MYTYYNPPYLLLVAGLLAGIASGTAFDATLRQSAREWSQNRSTRSIANMQGLPLLLPFWGVCGGVCLFLGSGLGIFGFPYGVAFGVSAVLTVGVALLIWAQLGRILVQLERGGSKAIDLDSFG